MPDNELRPAWPQPRHEFHRAKTVSNNDQNDCGTDCAWETTLTLPEELQAASDEWLQVVTSRSGDLRLFISTETLHILTVELGNGGSLMCSSFQPTMIGKEYANGGWWTGDLKNLALWERAISAQEVSQWVGGGCNCSGAMLDDCGECAGDNSSCSGCTDDQACNFDEEATLEDGSCFYFSVELPALCLESDSMMATALAVGIDLTFGAAAEAFEGYQFIGQSDSSRYYLSDESYNLRLVGTTKSCLLSRMEGTWQTSILSRKISSFLTM